MSMLRQPSPRPRRPYRRRRYSAALLTALTLANVAVLSATPAGAVPAASGPAGTIQTMGGATVNFKQGGYGPENVLATSSQFSIPRGLNFDSHGNLFVSDALNH